ncbi:uncharacterized protein T551_03258 [Pneumocystis jirovecii RU7]|uniref:FYVE-type domain-containing protein n=1 Tax=Pneumocystis jirovecii (strain RU7) TaxID=1408657 RepID=A0A0W4ZEK9_PNEJ7|nr:uncharacterized protein T551_03258 [Pneumocystis jirovecii RU7]KTW26796.1 hypothetical protein T551_03258 [Pneumocystis jirovecii RU7]
MLLCPVCNKSLVDLYRLNQHLDEVHFKVVEKQETVKSWFKKCVEEAKHLASVAVAQNIINRSDVFELNENKVDYGETGREIETVTKEHWKIGTEDTVCSRVSCKKPLSVKADRVNWRDANTYIYMCMYTDIYTGAWIQMHLYITHVWYMCTFCMHCMQIPCAVYVYCTCNIHTLCMSNMRCVHCIRGICVVLDTSWWEMRGTILPYSYNIKLSKEARHDPMHGIWSRVCKNCYEEREGYMDTNGPIIDFFPEFKQHRTQAVHKINLYANRLEKRLSKLTNLLTSNPTKESTTNSFFKPFISFKLHKKALEQTVVSWESDLSVTHCPLCRLPFSHTNRKHHCRLCGKIVCDGLKALCSSKIRLDPKDSCSAAPFDAETGTLFHAFSQLYMFSAQKLGKQCSPFRHIHTCLQKLPACPFLQKRIPQLSLKATGNQTRPDQDPAPHPLCPAQNSKAMHTVRAVQCTARAQQCCPHYTRYTAMHSTRLHTVRTHSREYAQHICCVGVHSIAM